MKECLSSILFTTAGAMIAVGCLLMDENPGDVYLQAYCVYRDAVAKCDYRVSAFAPQKIKAIVTILGDR